MKRFFDGQTRELTVSLCVGVAEGEGGVVNTELLAESRKFKGQVAPILAH